MGGRAGRGQNTATNLDILDFGGKTIYVKKMASGVVSALAVDQS